MATGTIGRMGIQTWRIWTNTDVTATFTAQTISLDLSTYDAVLVVYVGATTYPNRMHSEIVLKDGHQYMLYSVLSGGTTVRNRGITVSNNGIAFSAGYSGGSQSNNCCIPMWIFGIRCIPLT